MLRMLRKHRIVVSAVGTSFVCAVLYVIVFSAHEYDDVRSAVSKQLIDPDAAHFRDIKRGLGKGDVICGYVNGKNSYGAYVGFRSFVFVDHKRVIIASLSGEHHDEQIELIGYFYSDQCEMPYLNK
jgi:hypothetical protein